MDESHFARQQRLVQLLVAAVCYAAFYIVFFLPVITPGNLFAFGDSWVDNLPLFLSPFALFWHDLGAGYPIWGDPAHQNSALFYLSSWLSHGGAWNFYILTAFVLGSTGTYGYVQRLTRDRVAGFASGLIFMLNGFLAVNYGMENMVHVVAYIPFVIWSVYELSLGFSKVWFVVGAVFVWLCGTSPYPQTFIHMLMLAAAYLLFVAFRDRRFSFATALTGAAMLLTGVLLAFTHLLPFYARAQNSWRTNMSFLDYVGLSVEPYKLIGLFFPALLGLHESSPYKLPYVGSGLPECSMVYMGSFTLLLAFIAIGRKPESQKKFWIGAATISFLLSLGSATPLARLFYFIPFYKNFRAQCRHLNELGFELAILAGFGIAYLLAKKPKLNELTKPVGIYVLLFAMAGLVLPIMGKALRPLILKEYGVTIHVEPWLNPAVGLPIIIFALSLSLVALWNFISNDRLRTLAVLALVVLDMGSIAWFAPWHYECHRVSELTMPAWAEPFRAELIAKHQRYFPIRGDSGNRDELPIVTVRDWHIPCVSMYAATLGRQYMTVMHMGEGGFMMPQKAWKNDEDQSLNLAAVRYISLPTSHVGALNSSRFSPQFTVGKVSFLLNKNALPMAWLVAERTVLPPERILDVIHTGQFANGKRFDGARTALVEESVALPVSSGSPIGSADILEDSDRQTLIRTKAESDRLLVLSVPLYGGSKASIDGNPTRVIRCNYAFQTIYLPAGEHIVRFWFDPPMLLPGCLVSLVSLFGLLFICWRYKPKRKFL